MGRRTTKQSSSSSWYSRSRSSSAPASPPDPPIGCMSMVHYLIFAPGAGCVGRPPTASTSHARAVVAPHAAAAAHHHHEDDDTRRRQRERDAAGGTEAPRNSLDLDADGLADVHIGVQVEPVFDALARTTMRRARATAPSSEAETPRTPSLVARLMGIDGLPDHHSPSPSPALSKKKENHHCSPAAAAGSKEKKKRVIPESMNREPLRSLSCNVPAGDARSLPETPRGSTSARASWDGPRLSLQALKENVLDRAAHYMSLPSSPTSSTAAGGKRKHKNGRRARTEDRERTAKEHAREILRQAKETVANRKSKNAATPTKPSSSPSPAAAKKQSTSNKENERPATEDKLVTAVAVVQPCKPAVAPPPKVQMVTEQQQQQPPAHAHRAPLAPKQQPPAPQRAKPSRPPPPPPPPDPPRARKPDGCERFATRIKTKAAAGGCQAPAAAAAAAATPSAPATSASSVSGRAAAASSSPSALEEDDPEYGYVRTVLERGGFMRATAAGRAFKGHSVAAPVDPIVFHLLELELPADEARLGPLRHRWNRKLLFHLTQELLADDLLGVDASSSSAAAASGAALLARLWRRARSFPAADCRVVGDIDALVAGDLASASVRRLGRHPAVAEEAGDVAEEVAERVLEALVAECAAESLSLSSPNGWSSSSSSRPAWWPSRAAAAGGVA
ncbi:hypothetical protein ACP4OV_010295 [Aristida adscensionis]